MKLRILYIEDNPLDAELVRETLRDSGFECDMKVVEMEAELRDSLSEQRYDLILSDCSLPTYDGIAALAVARMVCPDTPFIFVSGTIGEEAAIECLKCGATDYVLKDRLARLPPVVRRALEEAEARRRHAETLRELTTSREAFFQSQKMETIGRLTGGLAHDFNNMLTVVVGYAEVIRARTKDGDPCNAFAGEILRASSRAAELVEQLLSYSRNQKLDPKVIDINDEIGLTVNMLTKLVGERIEVATDLSEDLWPVVIDPVRFDQIMMNLAANARDAMPDGGTLIIETGNVPMDDPRVVRIPGLQRGDYVVVGVIDNGTGMDEETMEKIFEPFFTTKEPGKGTGLGLASAHGIVTQSGGTITVRSASGVGTKFELFLPRSSRRSPEPPMRRTRAPKSPAKAPHASILLVDDDGAVLRFLKLTLELAGYTVRAAATASEALTIARNREVAVDLVITDVMLPDARGSVLAADLQRRWPGVPVLYTSGYANSTLLETGMSQDTVPLLRKPTKGQTLLTTVRELLDDAPAQ